jgi:hydroxymethylglutaryl-CoA lyase
MQQSDRVYITECPRDAMQGLSDFIPTDSKIDYLNALLEVGFDTLDFGSFVSPKAIPQLSDTARVLDKLNWKGSDTSLLAIIANERGCDEALKYDGIRYIGYPFSVSETFQLRNTNRTVSDSFELVKYIRSECTSKGKEPVIYLSMAFGNPYGDPWNADVVTGWALELEKLGIRRIALADTVGIASSDDVFDVTSAVVSELKEAQIIAHLHCRPDNWEEKADAAYRAGCRHFDTALRGFGGCPMAEDELVGNLATENLVQYLDKNHVHVGLNRDAFEKALIRAGGFFK